MSIVSEDQILEQIKRLLGDNHVVVFMKGVPESPRCGFSARVVARLDEAGIEYGAVDVLVDPRFGGGVTSISVKSGAAS